MAKRREAMSNEPIDKKVEFKGLRTQDEAVEVGFDGMTIADNIDYTRKNKIKRRPGRADTTYVPGGTIHSAWADKQLFLFQEGTSLLRFRSATDVTTLATGLTIGGRISAHRIADRVYWSNGTETGVIDAVGNNRDLGVPVPARFVGTATTGNMGVGRYSYCFTEVAGDERESGAPQPITASLEENSGLSFTLPAGLARRFWISESNGDTLYLAAEIPVGETSFVYRNRQPLTSIPLDRMLMSPPAAWHEIDWFRASMLMAVDDRVEWTNEFDYELRDIASNYMPFGEKVHIIAGLEDGFYVGTDSAHYYFAGASMDTLSMLEIADYGAVPGTKVHISGNVVGSGEATEKIPVWTTQTGVVVGLPGGTLKNVHERVVDFSTDLLQGTALYRRASKQNHYVTQVSG